MGSPRTKSLIVALAEAKGEPLIPAIRDLQDWTKKLAHIGSNVDGALELAWRRGEHAGYLQGYADGEIHRASKYTRRRSRRPPKKSKTQ